VTKTTVLAYDDGAMVRLIALTNADVADAIAALGARHKFIRPHCPWQNGKVERLNRTLQTGWAYRQAFTSNDARAAALAPWIEHYNTERRHSAFGGTKNPCSPTRGSAPRTTRTAARSGTTPQGWPTVRRLHRHGPGGRERRVHPRHQARGPRPLRRPLAESRREGHLRRLLGPRDHPTLADSTVVSADDGPRAGVIYDAISQLQPVFRPDGVVTAGICCPLNDGAAAVVIMSDTKAAELGLAPLARIVSTGVSGLSPEIMGLGPAFAAQVLPSAEDLGIPIEKLNVNGGAIAIGHPFGMTGARLQNTLINSLQWHDKSTGLITMCVGGGQGMAMILERLT
jgi:hypothetical protein